MELYSSFKCWFKEVFPGDKIPNRYIFRAEMEQRLGNMQNNYYYGIRFLDIDNNLY